MRRFSYAILLIVIALYSARHAYAAGQCTPLKTSPTDIQVTLTIPEPYYDTSLSWSDLAKKRQSITTDWLKKNNLQGMWNANDLKVAGDASGGWGIFSEDSFTVKPFDHYGAAVCPFFKTLHIDLFYRTLIEIPKDFLAQPCVFKTVQDHELMHHAANSKAVQIYVDRLRGDLVPIIAQLEENTVPRRDLKARAALMQQGIRDAVQVYFNEAMTAKMNELNALIDTPQEYAVRSVMMEACRKNESP